MADRFQTRQIGDNVWLISDRNIILAAVWRAPSPWNDWYWGRVTVTRDSYDLIACGVADTRSEAIELACREENRVCLMRKESRRERAQRKEMDRHSGD